MFSLITTNDYPGGSIENIEYSKQEKYPPKQNSNQNVI